MFKKSGLVCYHPTTSQYRRT